METDCIRFVRKFHQSHIRGDLIRIPPNKLYVTSSPWTFVAWGMDIICPIELSASNGHSFILVAIGFFTKWVEASSYKYVTKKVVTYFVCNNLICRYGIPESIITDNGANLSIGLMHEICEKFKIIHHNSTPYRPQMNGTLREPTKISRRYCRK
ncbi:uncharacterized protein K02A2.6-like [Solanum tuberosum]|uniref:uncharacterized protein K02A2.6-like n=1 Tax=Solanum tuberosum TaxID=4113 RepID=UPI000739FCF9|nr:PREDICTED: uncharacterized protein K02A2.6-like [Solanum tuberosum]